MCCRRSARPRASSRSKTGSRLQTVGKATSASFGGRVRRRLSARLSIEVSVDVLRTAPGLSQAFLTRSRIEPREFRIRLLVAVSIRPVQRHNRFGDVSVNTGVESRDRDHRRGDLAAFALSGAFQPTPSPAAGCSAQSAHRPHWISPAPTPRICLHRNRSTKPIT